MAYVTPGYFKRTNRRSSSSPAVRQPARTAKASSVKKALLTEQKRINKVSAPNIAGWLHKSKHRLGEKIMKPIPQPQADRIGRKLVQGYRTSSGSQRKNTFGHRMPHVKTSLPEEILESDFTPNVIHYQADFKMPVEIKVKRTSGRMSSMMKMAIAENSRKTFNLMKDYSVGKADPLKRNLYNLLDEILYSVCGFNRAGIFWPWWYMEWEFRPNETYTRFDTEASNWWPMAGNQAFFDFINDLSMITPTIRKINPFLIAEGDQDLLLPIREFRKTYELQNMNSELPMYASIYLCTPRSDLTRAKDPLHTWMKPTYHGRPKSASINDYAIDVMDFQYGFKPNCDKAPNAPAKNNSEYTTTAGLEVVRGATPYLSKKFKENWEVLDVKSVRLLPQQICRLELEQILNSMTSVKRVTPMSFRNDAFDQPFPLDGENTCLEGITIFPIIKFWGENVVARQSTTATDGWSKMQKTIEGTGPSALKVSITRDELVHYSDSSKVRGPTSQAELYPDPGWKVTGRSIREYDDYTTFPYAMCNSFGSLQNNPGDLNAAGDNFDAYPASSFDDLSIDTVSTTDVVKLRPIAKDES